MSEQSFAAAYSVAARTTNPGAVVLRLIPQFLDVLDALRYWLSTSPEVTNPKVRDIASKPGLWNHFVDKSRLHIASRPSYAARLALCQALVVRVLRTPDGVDDDAYTARARHITALIGIEQLRMLDAYEYPITRPRVSYLHYAAVLGLDKEGKSTKRRIAGAVQRGMLSMSQAPEQGVSGKWHVRPLDEHDDALDSHETAIAAALAGPSGEVLDPGLWGHAGAELLRQAGHPLFNFDKAFGPNAWLRALRVEAGFDAPEDDIRLARTLETSDLDALISGEARELWLKRGEHREVQKTTRKTSVGSNRDGSDLAWRYLKGRFEWDAWKDADLIERVADTLGRVDSIPDDLAPDALDERLRLKAAMRPALRKALARHFHESENRSGALILLEGDA